MRKSTITLLLCLCALCMLPSCQSSRMAAVEDLRDLRNDIRDEGIDYGILDWRHAIKKYKKIEKRLAKHNYTDEEQKEIGELKGECYSYFAKSVAGNVAGKVANVSNQLKGIVDGMKKAWNE